MPSYIEIAPDGTRREVKYARNEGPVSKRIRIISKLKWLGRRPHLAKPGEVSALNRALRDLQFPSNPRASSRLPALNRQGPLVADIPDPLRQREPHPRSARISGLDRKPIVTEPDAGNRQTAQAGARSDGSLQLSPHILLTGGI